MISTFLAFVLVWLYTILPNLADALGALTKFSIIGLIGLGVLAVATIAFQDFTTEAEDIEALRKIRNVVLAKWAKRALITLIVCTVGQGLIPDKSDMKLIVGVTVAAYVTNAIVEVEGVKEIPENTVAAINNLLKGITTEGVTETRDNAIVAVKERAEVVKNVTTGTAD